MKIKKMQKAISSILIFTFVMFNLMSMGNIITTHADTAVPATIAAWDYTATPTVASVPATSGLLASGAVLTNFKTAIPTYSSSSLSLSGWDGGAGSKCWQISLSTKGYENLTLASKFRSSGTGPRDFKVTYSTDNGINWNDFANNTYAITTTSAISYFVPDNLPLPAGAANADSLLIKFIMTSNISSRAGTGSYLATDPVASGGTSNINNITVIGTPISQTPTEPIPVTGVNLDKSALSLAVGQTATLTATVAPSTATNKAVNWASSDNNVATVVNGVVTGVAEGTANITATSVDGNIVSPLCVITVTANAPPTNKTFDIVEITDFHGQLLDSTNTKPVGAALAYLIKNNVIANNPTRTLVIGGGDLYQGTPISNVLHGVPVEQVMSNIGMEVTALGNHEFDWGLDVINNQTMVGANYSIVCANMYNKGTNDRPYKPYKIITKDGVRIAVIGAILKDAPTIIMPALVAPFDFRDPATEINACAKEIRDGNLADIVLADIHDGGDSLNTIVNNLHGVDAVFGGHTHTTYDGVNTDADGKSVPTLNAKNAGAGYIDLKITVDPTNKIVGFSPKGSNWYINAATTSSPTDPACKAIVDAASADLLPIFNEIIGHDDATYTSGQVDSPYGESQLGNWMADVVKNYVNADVGMVNNGGIRLSPIPAGNITVGTIFNLMPFDNDVTYVTMTGAQLKKIFEQAVQDNGKGIQISGVKFAYDSTKPSYKPAVVDANGNITTPEVPGQRVLSITRESNGSPVLNTDILKVAAPDFVATGGDTFTGFLDPSIVNTYVDTHVTVRDALNADVRAKGKITVVMNNRVDNQVAEVTPTVMTIAQARTAALGTAVTLTGIVSAVNGNNVFIQDAAAAPTAGICVYNSGGSTFTVHKGDNITVTGPLSVYSGLLEVTPSAAAKVTVNSSGNAVTPKEVTVSGATNAIQGQLVKIKSLTIDSIDNAGATMAHDSTGSINIYKMPVVSGLAVKDTADITAAVTCYGTTIELAVDSAADVVKTNGAPAPSATISIVGTSDIHGAIYPLDYNTGLASNVGLARVSTYVKKLRANNPYTMLIDNGDTIQGTPLVYYYNMIDKTAEYPMMKVMGAMGYDSWTLGNHEFNYGLDTLNRVIADATKNNITVLSANTYKDDNTNFVKPYYTKSFSINGKTIKVGILGLTTKCIPNWEDPAHYAGLHFNDLVTEAQKWVPILKNDEKCDVVIVAAHTGTSSPSDTIPENQADLIAKQVGGIDAILCGHAHTGKTYSFTNPDGKVIPVVEPKNGDGIFSQIDINVDGNGIVTGVTAKNIDTSKDSTLVADPAILALAQPYQDATLAYTNTVIGQSTAAFEGAKQLTEPSSIMELVNKVQMNAAGSQLSIAAPLSLTAAIPQGDIKRQDIMGVYVYENFLFGVNMTGKQLKNWLEWSVRYYKQTTSESDSIVKDPVLNVPDYNLDQLYGATYDIDLSQPACTTDANGLVVSGDRIKNLKFNGRLVKDTDVFKIAINNYRYNGGGGFMAAAGLIPGSAATIAATYYDSAKALGDDGQVRNLMFKYVQDNGTISPTNSNNWKISTMPVVQEIEATGVTLNESSLNLVVGKTETLVAKVLPENATNKAVVWSSSNDSIATVKDGVVTAVNGGNAVITVTTIDGKFTANCAVNSIVLVTGISLNKQYITIKPGEIANLVATVTPPNATDNKVVWKSSNPAIATVDENGIVTGKSIGAITITATTEDGNYTASANAAVVKVPVKSVRLNRKSVIVTKNDTVKLIANINPGNASVTDLVWSIDNAELGNLVVDGKTATLTSLKAGTVKITVTTLDGGYTDECTVNSIVSVTGISLNKQYITIKPGEVANLVATVTPPNATNNKVIWKSSNPAIATVDENGTVTGKSIGAITITAITKNGKYTASTYVAIVKVPVKSIRLNQNSAIITKNNFVKLVANINPGNASVNDLVWSIDNAKLGSLVFNGKTAAFIGLKAGTVKITVTTLDGGYTDECTITVVPRTSSINEILKQKTAFLWKSAS